MGTVEGYKRQWLMGHPSPSMDPIANIDLTAKISYSVLARSNQTEHRSVAKFRDTNILVAWTQAWASLRKWRFVGSVRTLPGFL